MKAALLLPLACTVFACNAQNPRPKPVPKEGVVVPPTDSSRYKMPVKEPSGDTSMNMPVVPPKSGVVPK